VKTQQSVTSALIINADDWGRDRETTDRIFECWEIGSLSSASAMVFMEDSARSAEIAKGRRVDCGLHLNYTTPFSASDVSSRLRMHQERITKYLRSSRFARTIFHPGLASSFEYVTSAQIEEFARIYGEFPSRYDGHHHMHLCANVLLGKLIPPGVTVRRNFSFRPSEKGTLNRFYRQMIDHILAKRYRISDHFFSLPPLEPRSRVDEIIAVARSSVVELETHPINAPEYKFLMCEFAQRACDLAISRAYTW
jgi:predicted glycoside hydrolase/deacetylase ChbG (UPF0249 family)